MRDVDLSALRIGEARQVVIGKPHPGLQRLFWSPQTDLALALLDDSRRLVYLGFDLAQSNFPLQAAFPLFISQSLAWLRPQGNPATSSPVAAGSVHDVALPANAAQVIVDTPSGKTATLAVKDGTLRFDDTGDAGFYRYSVGGASRYFAVTLCDARESDVNKRWPGSRRADAPQSARSGAQALTPLWPKLLMLALVLLVLEWGVWMRSRGHA